MTAIGSDYELKKFAKILTNFWTFLARNVLIRYLKVRDYDLDEAKKLVDANVKFRIKNKYLFTNRDIDSEDFQKLFTSM